MKHFTTKLATAILFGLGLMLILLYIDNALILVSADEAKIIATNIGVFEQKNLPAQWPISSSIPIYLTGHMANTSYDIKVDGSSALMIETNSVGHSLDSPNYYFVTGQNEGDTVTISSGVATTTAQLVKAKINLSGYIESAIYSPGDQFSIVLESLAPLQEYTLHFDDGITQPLIVKANADGSVFLSYVIPPFVPEFDDPWPFQIEIFVLDWGRGFNPNKIATRTIEVTTPSDPYIKVSGGFTWPAGSAIAIEIYEHIPNTAYDLRIERGSSNNPIFSEIVDFSPFITNGNGYSWGGQIIPETYYGYYILRSFEEGTTNEVAASPLKIVSPSPSISIDDGNLWSRGDTIVVRLEKHFLHSPYEIWFDRNGPEETFLGGVLTDSSGEATLVYKIPDTLPGKVEPGYEINSYDAGNDSMSIATGELQIKTQPDLTISKKGPAFVDGSQPIAYTLTITNSGDLTATNLIVTDTIPTGATYLSGGAKTGNVVNWMIPSLAAQGGVTQTSFVVTASQTITNSDYIVRADEGVQASGQVPVVTMVEVNSDDTQKIFLPVILK